jgi:transposase-like protein
MSKSILNAKAFQSEKAAYEWLESRIWPEGPVCPHCGGFDRIGKMKGSATRFGLYKCYQCRKQFRATVGTVFEKSHVPMTLWLQAMYLLASSKKGISSNQLHRALGVSLKTAWFISHRLRLAMAAVGLEPLSGEGATVEADETYVGRIEEPRMSPQRQGRPFIRGGKHSPAAKRTIVALVERGGKMRSFHVERATKESVAEILRANVAKESRLHTDESRLYGEVGAEFAKHETVRHSRKEYVRGDVHTNTLEGAFGVFKRGMKGVYQHCAEKHLHRYLSEFDFRYNNRIALGVDDVARTDQLAKGIVGKRLTYRTTN